ncbi:MULTISPECIES: hypothetical protein [unclassified Mesorhizobium]|uniref:hypothetical protein n=1 Tax=unclassified Mesorhizobium TaxID=325217 RepID=UPI000AB76881|nr:MULTISPECIES: hypothetical protein [unclassified Mesorhizobium]
MEDALDDLARILTAPQTSLRTRYGAFAMRMAESLATGLAIGVGIALVLAVAG